jgi:hypothetical protein
LATQIKRINVGAGITRLHDYQMYYMAFHPTIKIRKWFT